VLLVEVLEVAVFLRAAKEPLEGFDHLAVEQRVET
jgi:hypothetical protein